MAWDSSCLTLFEEGRTEPGMAALFGRSKGSVAVFARTKPGESWRNQAEPGRLSHNGYYVKCWPGRFSGIPTPTHPKNQCASLLL